MGQGPSLIGRRALLGGAAATAAGLASCRRDADADWSTRWVDASAGRGHRLRAAAMRFDAAAVPPRRAGVVVVGAGVAGLAAVRALQLRGVDDVQLLDLEDAPGGNSRAHALGGQRCPLGAHYLPLPGPEAIEVAQWLHEIGLLRQEAGRTVADERHLCHSPQERLFFDGEWHDGLLPPAAPGSSSDAQYRRFAAEVARAQRDLGFAIPTARARWSAAHEQLDHLTFAAWLDARALTDAQLRWYLDYACRDDYGAGAETVSAWAGLHYFASRHGFHAPGTEGVDREAVFTWPEGNAWLVERLAAPVVAAQRWHGGRVVLRVDNERARDAVEVWAWREADAAPERWRARAVVLAVPLFVAARLLAAPPPALLDVVPRQVHAPWLVANLALRAPLADRPAGAAPAWDNVRYGSPSLGYVDATHQRLTPAPAARPALSAYWALPTQQRAALLDDASASAWAARVIEDLAVAHPDLPRLVERVDLMRYGHAMSVPAPGLRSQPALRALTQQHGRVAFAHADLAAYSVFEEAFCHGMRAGAALRL